MKRAGSMAAAFLVLVAVFGCEVALTGDDLLMCNAARFLSGSIAVTEDALAIDAAGRPVEATERAIQGIGLAESAARTLQEVDDAAQADPNWVSLITAYKHASQAASSLLPEFQELRGTGAASLSDARSALDGARLGLPPACFAGAPT